MWTVEWDSCVDNLLVAEINGQPTWDDYYQMESEMMDMITDSGKKQVDVTLIVNASTPDSSPLSHFRNSARRWQAHPASGMYIVVIPDTMHAIMVKTMLTVLKHVQDSPFDYPTVRSLAAARELVRDNRNTQHT